MTNKAMLNNDVNNIHLCLDEKLTSDLYAEIFKKLSYDEIVNTIIRHGMSKTVRSAGLQALAEIGDYDAMKYLLGVLLARVESGVVSDLDDVLLSADSPVRIGLLSKYSDECKNSVDTEMFLVATLAYAVLDGAVESLFYSKTVLEYLSITAVASGSLDSTRTASLLANYFPLAVLYSLVLSGEIKFCERAFQRDEDWVLPKLVTYLPAFYTFISQENKQLLFSYAIKKLQQTKEEPVNDVHEAVVKLIVSLALELKIGFSRELLADFEGAAWRLLTSQDSNFPSFISKYDKLIDVLACSNSDNIKFFISQYSAMLKSKQSDVIVSTYKVLPKVMLKIEDEYDRVELFCVSLVALSTLSNVYARNALVYEHSLYVDNILRDTIDALGKISNDYKKGIAGHMVYECAAFRGRSLENFLALIAVLCGHSTFMASVAVMAIKQLLKQDNDPRNISYALKAVNQIVDQKNLVTDSDIESLVESFKNLLDMNSNNFIACAWDNLSALVSILMKDKPALAKHLTLVAHSNLSNKNVNLRKKVWSSLSEIYNQASQFRSAYSEILTDFSVFFSNTAFSDNFLTESLAEILKVATPEHQNLMREFVSRYKKTLKFESHEAYQKQPWIEAWQSLKLTLDALRAYDKTLYAETVASIFSQPILDKDTDDRVEWRPGNITLAKCAHELSCWDDFGLNIQAIDESDYRVESYRVDVVLSNLYYLSYFSDKLKSNFLDTYWIYLNSTREEVQEKAWKMLPSLLSELYITDKTSAMILVGRLLTVNAKSDVSGECFITKLKNMADNTFCMQALPPVLTFTVAEKNNTVEPLIECYRSCLSSPESHISMVAWQVYPSILEALSVYQDNKLLDCLVDIEFPQGVIDFIMGGQLEHTKDMFEQSFWYENSKFQTGLVNLILQQLNDVEASTQLQGLLLIVNALSTSDIPFVNRNEFILAVQSTAIDTFVLYLIHATVNESIDGKNFVKIYTTLLRELWLVEPAARDRLLTIYSGWLDSTTPHIRALAEDNLHAILSTTNIDISLVWQFFSAVFSKRLGTNPNNLWMLLEFLPRLTLQQCRELWPLAYPLYQENESLSLQVVQYREDVLWAFSMRFRYHADELAEINQSLVTAAGSLQHDVRQFFIEKSEHSSIGQSQISDSISRSMDEYLSLRNPALDAVRLSAEEIFSMFKRILASQSTEENIVKALGTKLEASKHDSHKLLVVATEEVKRLRQQTQPESPKIINMLEQVLYQLLGRDYIQLIAKQDILPEHDSCEAVPAEDVHKHMTSKELSERAKDRECYMKYFARGFLKLEQRQALDKRIKSISSTSADVKKLVGNITHHVTPS